MGRDLDLPDAKDLFAHSPISSSGIELYHPLDVLYRVNPEIASLAYAHREKWLTTEMLPHLAKFRRYQSQERIAVLRSIVDSIAIESDERIQLDAHRTLEAITQMEQEGKLERTKVRSEADVETNRMRYDSERNIAHTYAQTAVELQRTRSQEAVTTEAIRTGGHVEVSRLKYGSRRDIAEIKAQAAVDVQKLKYEAGLKIMEAHLAGERYLSDNQLKALRIEVGALREVLRSRERIEKMRLASQEKNVDAELKRATHEVEMKYMAEIYKAEQLRNSEHDHAVANVVKAYVLAQARMFRDSCSLVFHTVNLKEETRRAAYGTMSKIARTALAYSHSPRTVITGSCDGVGLEVTVEREERGAGTR